MSNGTEASPSIDFLNNTGNGFFLDNLTNGGIGVSCEGQRVFTFLPFATGFNSTVLPMRFQTGDVNQCAIFPGTSTVGRGTGIYWDGTNGVNFNIASSAVLRLTINSAATFTVPIRTGLGTVSLPSYSFSGDNDTGVYSSAANNLDFATAGVNRLNISSTAITSTLPLRVPAGSASAVAVGNGAGYGTFSPTTDVWAVSTASTERLRINTTAIVPALPITGSVGTAGAPSYSFTGRTSTGMYSSAADTINFATNGVNRMTISNSGITFSSPPSFTSSYQLLVKSSTPQAGTGSPLLLTWTSSASSGSDLSFASNVVTINTTGIYLVIYNLSGGNSSGGTINILNWLEINSSGVPNGLYTNISAPNVNWSAESSAILSLTATNTIRIIGNGPASMAFNDVTGSRWSVYKLF